MSPPTPLIRLSRPQDGQPVPLRARAGPSNKLPPSTPTDVSTSVSSTTSSSPSSTAPQTSLQTSSTSVRAAATTTDSITTSSSSSSPTSSPETSSSALSTTPAPVQPTSPVLAPSGDVTVTVTSSVDRAQSTQPSNPPPTQASHTSFLQNKPAMIAVFSIAGVVALIVVILLGTVVVRRRRRERLIKEAIDFSPTADHLIDVYNDGRSDNDEKGGTGSSLRSISGSTSRRAYGVPSPSLLPPPVPVPPLRDAQQQGPGTGFAGSGISYDNSSYAYYDTGRPQWQQQPQQQLLPPPPQQPSWQQRQAEWVQQQDFQSDVRHPSVLVPARHQVAMQASHIPYSSPPARTSPPPGVTGGLRGLGPSQNEYMRAPSPAARETLRRGGGRL
ncbi:hypothetical protein BC827DRAFT_1208359 [Russula dissimulans]|nr:hypothetical protein BC827DRAFT_1208359 [Russula dissimulans]